MRPATLVYKEDMDRVYGLGIFLTEKPVKMEIAEMVTLDKDLHVPLTCGVQASCVVLRPRMQDMVLYSISSYLESSE